MGIIKLATYDIILPNYIFGRKVDPMKILDKVLPATQLTELRRYKVPSQSELIDFIRKSAGNLSGDDEITSALKFLPASEAKSIAEGNEYSLHHLGSHCSDFLEQGRSYIEALNGVIPTEFLNRLEASIPSEIRSLRGEFYHMLIKKIGGNEWTLRIRLSNEGLFPEISELEHLLDLEVRDSALMKVDGASKDYPSVANHTRLLYNALNDGQCSYLMDFSGQLLRRMAQSTITEAGLCIAARATENITCNIKHKAPESGDIAN